MMFPRWITFACLALCGILPAKAEECLGNCGKAGLLPIGIGKPGRKYARDRLVDIRHLALDVTPDFQKRSVRGTVSISFAPVGLPVSLLPLDSIGLEIESVMLEGATLARWERTEETVNLHFAEPIAVGKEVKVTISYRGEPTNGLHFRTPEQGYAPGDLQVWTQGEAEFHRFWFPCYDYPNERFTSEVICHAPAGMEVISNGRLVAQNPAGPQGLTTWHWKQEQPHVNYLIALAAGHFHKLEKKMGELPMALFVPPSEMAQAEGAFRDTEAILKFFQQEIGVAFPWAKYHQVYCLDFLAGGMENTSCSFMAVSALVPQEAERLDTVHRLDAHELAHQWFGNLVTCRDWSHLWLNEGFASYYTVLYEAQKNGPEGMLLSLRHEAQRVINSKDVRPIVWKDYAEPMQQFDSRAYPKGAWVLHMLRSQLGPELFRTAIRTYLERHRNGIVTTDDLQDVLEEVSGKSLDQFFDQWVHHGGVPELSASYQWDEKLKLVRLDLRQKQPTDDNVRVFRLPIPVRFFCGDQIVNHTMDLNKVADTFYFSLPSPPEFIRIDPEMTLLLKSEDLLLSPTPEKALNADFLTKLIALQALAKKGNEEAISKIAETLSKADHYAVRVEAAKALETINKESARNALLKHTSEPDERVRLAVINALSAKYHPTAQAALVAVSRTEKNPIILSQIIQTLSSWPDFDPIPFLAQPSYENRIATAALTALGQQNRVSALPQILQSLPAGLGATNPTHLMTALEVIAQLGEEKPTQELFETIAKYLQHPHKRVRIAATKALGDLGYPAAKPILQALAKEKHDPAAPIAEESLAKLATRKSPSEQTSEAWKKVEEFQRKADELQQKIENLEKQQQKKSEKE
jgi:aminopeptidase N